MSNELKIIDSREVLGKQFKMYGDLNSPLFLAKDVASWIENSNVSQMVRNIEEDEKLKEITPIYNVYNGQYENQECLFLTEDGLYEVLMQSRKPIAKAFKKEVKIILKSVRKHGAYMTEETLEKAITSPDFLIRLATELKNEQEQRKVLETKIEEDKPYTSLGNAVSSSQGSILVRELSKLLNQNGVDTGEKRLYSWLRDNGFIIKKKGNDYNLPTQRSMNLGLMEVKETVVNKWDGNEIKSTTKITGKGQEYFINKFLHMQEENESSNLIVI